MNPHDRGRTEDYRELRGILCIEMVKYVIHEAEKLRKQHSSGRDWIHTTDPPLIFRANQF